MDKLLPANSGLAVTDVYTNISGLQQLGKNENQDEALKKVAQQFESMFINMMLKNMRQANAVFEKDGLFNSKEGNFYRDMHDHQLSLTLAHNQSLGIADLLYKQLSRNYGNSETSSDMLSQQAKVADRISIADSPKNFVDKVMPYLKKAAKALGVEAEMLAAQTALETGWGKFMLADKNGDASNNLFNIKRDETWQGDTVEVNSLEEKNGVLKQEKSDFKAYEGIEQAVNDYVNLIQQKPHYASALKSAANAFDYINKLQKAGYATDSKYAEKVFTVYKQVKQMGGIEK